MRLVLALAMSVIGSLTSTVGVVAQTAAPDVAPWVSGGGAAAAVGGLVYVARLLATGQLVHVSVEDREKQLRRLVHEGDEREEKLHELAADAATREDLLHRLLINRSARDDLTTGELRRHDTGGGT